MFRTVSGQKVGDDMKVSSEQTSAVTSVQKILLAVSRLAERGHQMQFTRTGGCTVNERNGSKIPTQLKNGVHTDEGAAAETAAHKMTRRGSNGRRERLSSTASDSADSARVGGAPSGAPTVQSLV